MISVVVFQALLSARLPGEARSALAPGEAGAAAMGRRCGVGNGVGGKSRLGVGKRFVSLSALEPSHTGALGHYE